MNKKFCVIPRYSFLLRRNRKRMRPKLVGFFIERFPIIPNKNELQIGDRVIVKHQQEMGECIVVNPNEQTLMKTISGELVGFYVRIDTPKLKNQGYYFENIEKLF